MIAVRDEGRPYFEQQRLQFRIRRSGNEHRVERVNDVLVIGKLAIDVGAIECCALERLQMGEVLFTA